MHSLYGNAASNLTWKGSAKGSGKNQKGKNKDFGLLTEEEFRSSIKSALHLAAQVRMQPVLVQPEWEVQIQHWQRLNSSGGVAICRKSALHQVIESVGYTSRATGILVSQNPDCLGLSACPRSFVGCAYEVCVECDARKKLQCNLASAPPFPWVRLVKNSWLAWPWSSVWRSSPFFMAGQINNITLPAFWPHVCARSSTRMLLTTSLPALGGTRFWCMNLRSLRCSGIVGLVAFVSKFMQIFRLGARSLNSSGWLRTPLWSQRWFWPKRIPRRLVWLRKGTRVAWLCSSWDGVHWLWHSEKINVL